MLNIIFMKTNCNCECLTGGNIILGNSEALETEMADSSLNNCLRVFCLSSSTVQQSLQLLCPRESNEAKMQYCSAHCALIEQLPRQIGFCCWRQKEFPVSTTNERSQFATKLFETTTIASAHSVSLGDPRGIMLCAQTNKCTYNVPHLAAGRRAECIPESE
jgi:hypothetical protein